MSTLPRKSVSGLPLKKYVLDTLNGLIDYLQTHRIRSGHGIDVQETASGYVINLARTPTNVPQVQNAGGGADGIDASVTGGTASITLTGGTGSVNLVGTGAASISKNATTGDIEINATGGTSTTSLGFPDYSSGMAVSGGTTYGGYANNGWLIGDVTSPNSAYATGDCECIVTLNGNGFSALSIVLLNTIGLTNFQNYAGVITNPVFLPIPANVSFNINPSVVSGQDATLNLKYYACITQ